MSTPLHRLLFSDPESAEPPLLDSAREVVTYHKPDDAQLARHLKLAEAASVFLAAIVANTRIGPERSTAIARAREAKMWASASIAMEGR